MEANEYFTLAKQTEILDKDVAKFEFNMETLSPVCVLSVLLWCSCFLIAAFLFSRFISSSVKSLFKTRKLECIDMDSLNTKNARFIPDVNKRWNTPVHS